MKHIGGGVLTWQPLTAACLPLLADGCVRSGSVGDGTTTPNGAVELDHLIGDAALRCRSLGTRMIAAAVRDTWLTFHPAAPAVLVAVVAAHIASWRAVEKAGLQRVAQGPIVPAQPD